MIFEETNSNAYDLTSVHFPKEGWHLPDVIDKPIYFCDAVFQGDIKIGQLFADEADFSRAAFLGSVTVHRENCDSQFLKPTRFCGAMFGCILEIEGHFRGHVDFAKAGFRDLATISGVFEAGADFSGSHFEGGSSFALLQRGKLLFTACSFGSKARFLYSHLGIQNTTGVGTADFRYALFGEAVFESVHFVGRTDFNGARFRDGLHFENTRFESTAQLTNVDFNVPQKVTFKSVDLSRVSLRGTDISQATFEFVTWDETKKGFLRPKRKQVNDETAAKRDWDASEDWPFFEAVAQVYRRLQANYGENYRYCEAADFYIGEQEMVRKAKGKFRRFVCLNFLYKIASNYGESYRRPFAGLVLTLVLFPVVFSFFDLRPNLPEKPLFDLLVDNLGFMTFSRTGMFDYFPDSFTRFLVITESITFVSLVTLFLLSLRRKFKRKSF
jgi:uncharacterized protein YjbI with pentapeptide repeats